MMDLLRRKKQWLDLYRMDGSSRFVLIADYYNKLEGIPLLKYDNKQERIDWALAIWEKSMEESLFVQDDFVPNLWVATGTEIFAQAMGCSVRTPEGSDSGTFVVPLIDSAAQVASLKVPRWQDTRLSVLFEIADELKEKAGHDAVLRMPDIQSPFDISALIWNKMSFYPALLDEPEAVHELIDKVTALLTGFLDAWFERYGTEYVAHCPDNFMHGGIPFSEDEIGAISPSLFREFVLPTLDRLNTKYDGLSMHCCANSEHQWENLKSVPGLKLLNLYRPMEIAMKGWQAFGAACAQFSWPSGSGDMLDWPSQYPKGAHVVLAVPATNREEAVDRLGFMREACRLRQ
jgi:hypothetical protein